MKRVIITGGAGGLGKVTSEHLVSQGWQVFSADIIHPDTHSTQNPQIIPVQTDITNTTSVQELLRFISDRTDGLDAIIHMAGTLILGSVVEIHPEEIERIMNINLMGVYRMNQAFLPLILKRKGRIITISSETGWQTSAPFNGPYSMSKHALEAYSDSLRRELKLLRVHVIKIQPGAIKAGLTSEVKQRFSEALHSSDLFKENISTALDLINKVYKKAADPQRFARVVHTALTARNPKTRYSVNTDKARSILEWLPVKWADRIYMWKLGNKKT